MKILSKLCIVTYAFFLLGCSDASDQTVGAEADDASAGLPVSSAQLDADSSPAAESDSLPNVIFILVDDLGWGDVGYNGSEIATPNLDQLADDGIRLDRNYVYPVCSSTRAAILTGQSPFAHGIDGPINDNAGMPLGLKIMPEYFKSLGYQTHMVGKWHLGLVDPAYFPIARGFDSHYGFLGGWVDYYTHVYQGGLDWQRDGVSLREEGHATDLLTAEALQVIQSKSSAEAPFFMYLSYNAPHTPLQPISEPTGLNESLETEARYVYGEMVTGLDAGIGEVLQALESEDLLDDTLIVFSSDNGGALRSGASNGDLREGKGGSFDGGIRVPGLVWWKGRLEGGRGVEQLVAAHDWLPTLMEAVGQDPSTVVDAYGQSMWAALAEGASIDKAPTTIGVAGSISVLDWPWKLVDHTARGPEGVRSIGLYNIQEDPSESVELSQEQPEKFAQLNGLIAALPEVESLRASGPPPDDQFTNEDGSWNFEFSAEESRSPWADGAASEL